MSIRSIRIPWWFLLIGALFTALITVLLINKSPAYALDNKNCGECHSVAVLSKKDTSGRTISLYVNQAELNKSAHKYTDCTTCHEGDPHKTPTAMDKRSLAEKCGTCHQYEYEQHLQSIHGQQLVQGNNDVATCVDCHSNDSNPHSVVRVLDYSAPAFTKNIAATCAKCHGQEELMASYGVVEKVYETYMRSFHGKALQLGTYKPNELDKATCTNCHGVHDIKAASDPSASVAGLSNLSVTCEQCHPGAGVKFASGFLGHREASATNIPIAHVTEIFFTTLLITVISFGVIVMLLAVRKFLTNRWREAK